VYPIFQAAEGDLPGGDDSGVSWGMLKRGADGPVADIVSVAPHLGKKGDIGVQSHKRRQKIPDC